MNNGTCTDGVASFSCNCIRGFTGEHCEISTLNEYFSYKCTIQYINYIRVISFFNNFNFDLDIDNCAPNNPCNNGGVCIDGIDDFSCKCADGWRGKTCNESNYVLSNCYKSSFKI